MGTPVGYDTVTIEDIGAILRKYHIGTKTAPQCGPVSAGL